MNTPDEIKRAIGDQFEILERLGEEIEEADSYAASEALRERLQQAKFDLGQLQKQLRQAEQAAQDQAHLAALAAYNKKLASYKHGLKQLDQLAITFHEILATLETAYQDHYELALELCNNYSKLSSDAKTLQQPDPPYPPGSPKPDSDLHELCKGLDGILTRKLTAYLDPLVLSGWAMPRQ